VEGFLIVNVYGRDPPEAVGECGKRFDEMMPSRAARYVAAVAKHPMPYTTLRRKLIDDDSVAYLVGQLTSPIGCPAHRICASI
jgi:hypothetical protein